MMYMAISTVQFGNFKINGEVTPEFVTYINNFAKTWRVVRSNKKIKKQYPNWKEYSFNGDLGKKGEYFACPEDNNKSITDYNIHPAQFSDFCSWQVVEENGNYYVKWNGSPEFDAPAPWLKYLLDNFFIPSGLSFSGASVSVAGQGDVFIMVIWNNQFAYYRWDKGDKTENIINVLKKECDDKGILNALDEILLHANEIDTLFSFDTDDDKWEALFESFFAEGTFMLPEDIAKMI